MNWSTLSSISELQDLKSASHGPEPIFIFKHSTRCPISSMAYRRLKNVEQKQLTQATVFYLDLLKYPSLSQKISKEFAVTHESPQLLLIKDGVCPFDTSHNGITEKALVENVNG